MKALLLSAPFWALGALALLILPGCGYPPIDRMFSSPLSLGIFGVIILVCNIIFMIEIVGSGRDLLQKILWIAFLWFVPGIGFICYLIFARSDFRRG